VKRAGGRSARLQAWFAVVFPILFTASMAFAADDKAKTEAKKPDPPRVTVVLPLAITAGATNQVKVRGNNLTNVTELRFTNDAFKPVITIKSTGKADLPKDADAKKLGDTQIEVELTVASDAPVGTNHFVVTSPDGTSEPGALMVFPAGSLTAEQEPNGGFKQAQTWRSGQTASGVIKEAGDVDVFRFTGKKGQRVRIEVCAATAGSALDSVVSLLDHAGHLLATNDDAGASRDSTVQTTLPADGDYLISLIDAHEKGGPTHVYLLSLHEGL
jgi:Bacterial pre-peptidase C-terminal domain